MGAGTRRPERASAHHGGDRPEPRRLPDDRGDRAPAARHRRFSHDQRRARVVRRGPVRRGPRTQRQRRDVGQGPGRQLVPGRAAAAGLARRDPMGAVGHSLRARDPAAAMAQLQAHVTSAWSIEDPALASATTQAWLAEHAYLDAERTPGSVLVCAVVFGMVGDLDEAASWLQWVEAREADLDGLDRFLLHGVWAHHLVQGGDPEAALERASRARAVLHEHEIDTVWAEALTLVAAQAQL